MHPDSNCFPVDFSYSGLFADLVVYTVYSIYIYYTEYICIFEVSVSHWMSLTYTELGAFLFTVAP